MTILQFLEVTSNYFAKNGVDSPRLTAELMLAEALKKKRMQLYLEFSAEVAPATLDILRPLVKRRASGEPLQYVQGYAEFHGTRFKVTPDVLIPRPETEILLEAVLKRVDNTLAEPICDVGTGSGILAVSLAKAFPDLKVYAVDVSLPALEVARSNGEGLTNLEFLQSRLLEQLTGVKFQLIVANLPYIPRQEIAGLSREVRQEPVLALDGGEDGLDLIRGLIETSKGQTNYLALEIGNNQAEAVQSHLLESGYETDEVIKDLCQVKRIVIGKYRG